MDKHILESYFDRLWPICRSITGNGLRQSFKILQELIPLELTEVPSGEKVYDWIIPREWNISEAYIEDSAGHRLVDFKKNNLHVLNYSIPIDIYMTLDELKNHLYSLPEHPRGIPYLTSYYKERWGFCLTHEQLESLKPGNYHAVIRSTLSAGSLTYGDCLLPSTDGGKDEILLSTYLCHPSMANNELSGPLVLAALYQKLTQQKYRRYNYRFVIAPETIGAIAYLSRHGERLKEVCKAGFIVTCCGDDRTITYKKSRRESATVDRCTLNVLKHCGKEFKTASFSPYGSDERQYSSPGFNLPIGSLMRSMYAEYPEYHTSLDNKSIISFEAMLESVELYLKSLRAIEANNYYLTTVPYGEPMLGPRGLYPTLGSLNKEVQYVTKMLFLINFSDGEHDLCDIAEKANCSIEELGEMAIILKEKGILVEK